MYRLLSLVVMLSVFGCTQDESQQAPLQNVSMSAMDKSNTKQEQAWQKVTVKYFDFEGGFYGLISSGNNKLLPMNLAKEYKVDGTTLNVKGHIIKDMITTQQWGQAFTVTDVELIKLGKGRESNKANLY